MSAMFCTVKALMYNVDELMTSLKVSNSWPVFMLITKETSSALVTSTMNCAACILLLTGMAEMGLSDISSTAPWRRARKVSAVLVARTEDSFR